ncbi:hypothetical protein, partial [Streptomyces sp. NPDC052015]|uniref:hypothetical protein n=1 Tax=Streptomyces sp. NPDC052015 TaxID=3154755 RepID=UPI00341D4ACC
DDEGVRALRRRQLRNLLTTLLLSTGVPMLVAAQTPTHPPNGRTTRSQAAAPLVTAPPRPPGSRTGLPVSGRVGVFPLRRGIRGGRKKWDGKDFMIHSGEAGRVYPSRTTAMRRAANFSSPNGLNFC